MPSAPTEKPVNWPDAYPSWESALTPKVEPNWVVPAKSRLKDKGETAPVVIGAVRLNVLGLNGSSTPLDKKFSVPAAAPPLSRIPSLLANTSHVFAAVLRKYVDNVLGLPKLS